MLAEGNSVDVIPEYPDGAVALQCAACGQRSTHLSTRGVCLECLTKIAQFNSMAEIVDSAMVGTERVAVLVPLTPPPSSTASLVDLFGQVSALWSTYPVYEGALADVDRMDPHELLVDDAQASGYLDGLTERGSEYRLIPAHQARALALIDFRIAIAFSAVTRRDGATP